MSTTAATPTNRHATLLALGAAVAALVGLYLVAVCTARGQWWDQRVWSEIRGLSPEAHHRVATAMRLVITPASCLAGLGLVGLVSWRQRRRRAAVVGVLCSAGTFVSAEALKAVLVRPDLGISSLEMNSFPSGHTGAVAALAVAAALSLHGPCRRALTALTASAAGLTGVAVVIAGWHRPSDPVASVLIAVVWVLLGRLALARWA